MFESVRRAEVARGRDENRNLREGFAPDVVRTGALIYFAVVETFAKAATAR